MKKLLPIILTFALCTSLSFANDTGTLNLIFNSELIESTFPVINYENYILVPIDKFLDAISIPYNIKKLEENKIQIEFLENILELYPNSHKAYINNQQVSLVVPTILQENITYISLNLISNLSNFYINYDNLSNSIFVTTESDFKKIKFFFSKVEDILKTFNSINIDIINEIIASDGSSYSVGNSIYIDKTLNKIFQKNILDNNWKESDIKLSATTTADFNEHFFAGISVDRINSNNDYIIFSGYYPLDNKKICNSTLYINPHNLEIEKQINQFEYENSTIKQTVFYSYK